MTALGIERRRWICSMHFGKFHYFYILGIGLEPISWLKIVVWTFIRLYSVMRL